MLYDLSNLRKLSDNDETFIVDMLLTFKKTAPPVMERMEEYVLQSKIEAAGREAHKLIPGVSFLGAKELVEVLKKVEENAKTGHEPEGMLSLVEKANSLVKALILEFEKDFTLE